MGAMNETTALSRRSCSVADSQPSAEAGNEVLTFRLGQEQYGVGILSVREIRSFEQPTRLANAPDWLLGVIDLRGTIVPVVDLRRRLGLAETAIDRLAVTMILDLGDKVIGAVVDAVSDVIDIPSSQRRSAPPIASIVGAGCIEGIASVPSMNASGERIERLVVLLDLRSSLLMPENLPLVETPAQ